MFSLTFVANLLRPNIYKTATYRTITTSFRNLAQHKQNLQPSHVSFDDVRFQKHLKSLVEIFKKHEGQRCYIELHCGFNHEVLNRIVQLRSEIDEVKSEIEELDWFISDLKKLEDELYNTALSEKESLENKLIKLKNIVLELIIPTDIVDDKDIVMELAPGVGGQEAMLFVKNMFEMYCHYASWKRWSYEILKYDTTDLGGIRLAHIAISGLNAFKILKYECGVHRVQRVPKTEKSGRIHTSTMTVAVLPQPSEIDIVIHPNEIELEFKRSSGAGGQHVNTTDSCVRIYHKPTGIVAESQMDRSQHKNRKLAMKSLRAKLYERKLEAIMKETTTSRKLQVGTAARSEKVRTYNYAQDRITDHRAHINVFGVDTFLQGEESFDRLSYMLQEWSNKQCLNDILNKYDST